MIHYFIKNWRTPTEDIGKALCVGMAWTRYSTGVLYPIIFNTAIVLSYMKSRTVIATRKFLQKCNYVINLNITYLQHPLEPKLPQLYIY